MSAVEGVSISAAAARVGLTAATLRAWERRYGVPRPVRSASGYRVYPASELERLQRMRALLDLGMRPGEAADLVRTEAPVDVLEATLERLLAAIEGFDAIALHTLLRGAGDLASPSAVFDRVITPLLARLDDPRFGLAHAHFAIDSLHAAAFRWVQIHQPAHPRATALLACFEGESHALPLFRLAFRLMEYAVGTVVLGARTPPEALGPVIARRQPAAVGLSITVAPPPARAEALLAGYARACGAVPWVVGGRGAAPLAAQIEAAGGRVIAEPGAFAALVIPNHNPDQRPSETPDLFQSGERPTGARSEQKRAGRK